MANGLYDAARESFLNADIDWSVDDIRAILVDTGTYTVNLTTHNFLDDIPAGARPAAATMPCVRCQTTMPAGMRGVKRGRRWSL